MSLARRLSVAAPLAVAVALLAHATLFGRAHAIAGAHESGLIGSALTALGLLFLIAVVGALGRDRAASRPARALSGPLGLAAWLALGAALGLGGIEAIEGHGLSILTSSSVLVVLPLAALATLGALIAERCAARLARALARDERTSYAAFVRFRLPAQPLALAFVPVAARRGRAPPR